MMTPEERKKRYDQAVAAREASKKNQGGYPKQEVPDFKYLTIAQNTTQIFRLVGNSLETRQFPSDPVLVERSLIMGDDGNYFNCIWSHEKDWPLRKLLTKLAKYEYNPETKKKTYINEGCPLLHKFLYNGQENNLYGTGMAPSKFVLFNAIDRLDTWCKENKHTKMLAWGVQEKDGKKFYAPGISNGFYKYIWQEKCSSIAKFLDEVDFVCHRYSEKTRPNEMTNYVVYWEEEQTSIKVLGEKDKATINYNDYIVKGFLSEEEENYERYNLENIPFISKPTPAGIILARLGKFLKDVDEKYKTTIVEELTALKAKEIQEFKNNLASSSSSERATFVESKPQDTEEDDPFGNSSDSDLPGVVETQPAQETPSGKVKKVVTPKVVKKEKFVIPREAYEHFGGLSELSEEEKSRITGVNYDEDKIIFSEVTDAECPACGNDIPDSFQVCGYCGARFAS